MTPEQEWRHLILSKIDKMDAKIDKIDSEMNTLKVKVAIFSSMAGSVVTIIINKFFN